MTPVILDPYPVIDSRGDLTPIVRVTFREVELRIAKLNLDDPQPPGYQYRLPLSCENKSWAANRDLVVEEGAYEPWKKRSICPNPLLTTPAQQGISYYEGGLWFHVGGSVESWCGDPSSSIAGDRLAGGGSWGDYGPNVRSAYQSRASPNYFNGNIGYRLLRGPLA